MNHIKVMSFRVCFAVRSVSVFFILFAVPVLQMEHADAAKLAPTSYQTATNNVTEARTEEKQCPEWENHPYYRAQSLRFLALLVFPNARSTKSEFRTVATVIHPRWLICSYYDFNWMDVKLNFLPIEKVYVVIEEPYQAWRKGKILRAVPHYRSHVDRNNNKVSHIDILLIKTEETAAYWKPVRLPIMRSQTDDCKQGIAYGYRLKDELRCYSGFKHYLLSGKEDECQPSDFPLIRRQGTICSRPCGYGGYKQSCWYGSPLFCENDPETLLGVMYITQSSTNIKGFTRIDRYIDFIRSTIYPELYNPESYNLESYNNCGKSKYKPHRISLLYFCVVILCIKYL